MKKSLGSVLCKVLVVAFIALGFMIIRPSAAYAEVTCTGITIEGPGIIDLGGNASYTARLTFNGVVNATNRPSISRGTDSLIPGG